MVTAELAVALPALVLVTLAAVAAVWIVVADLRCQDAAAGAARLAARGGSGAVIAPLVRSDAPAGAALQITADQRTVTATVRTTLHPLGFLPGVTVTAHVTEPIEEAAP
jgi:hypothetical protein